MRQIALILALCLVSPASAETVRLGDRSYDITLPSRPEGAPMILALHGGGGNPEQFASASGLGKIAARKGYAVIFPAGSGRRGDRLLTWNAGYCCGYAARRNIGDEAFLTQVLDDAADRFGLDGTRVYLTGMSNGSIMAETFAARNPDRVRAVAGVAGTMDASSLAVTGRVPALIIHGTADAMVPYEGGKGDRSLTQTEFASVAAVVEDFLAPWGKGLTSASATIDRKDDGTSIMVTNYRKGSLVVLRLIRVEGGAHHWPGGRKARLSEGKTQEIDANTEILQFFALYP